MENKMIWHLNDLCNLACEYCSFHHDKTNPAISELGARKIYEAFKSTNRKWSLFIAGGEPLLYPDFNETINLLQEDHQIIISTNLFNKKVGSFATEVSPSNIYVVNASLHITQHNDKSLNKFISNYHLLIDRGFTVIVSYVTYPPLFDRMKSDFQFLQQQGVQHIHPLTYQGIHNGKAYPASYTEEQVKMICDMRIDDGELFAATNSLNFKGDPCKAGSNYFYLQKNGDVLSCATVRKPLGNLFDGTFRPNQRPMLCPVSCCSESSCGVTSLVEDPGLPETPRNGSFFYPFDRIFARLNS